MMLPSPVTSTPFSVKDILKLEQQSRHLQSLHPAQHHAQLHPELQERFQAPSSCFLGGGDSPGFSDNDEKMSFLNSLSMQDSLVESSLSPPMFVHPALGHVDTKLEDELEDHETSGWFVFTTEVNEFETDQEIELIVSLNTVRQREKERLKTRKNNSKCDCIFDELVYSCVFFNKY